MLLKTPEFKIIGLKKDGTISTSYNKPLKLAAYSHT